MKKIYKITGYLYVPVDGEVLASSKTEAKEKYIGFCNSHTTGYNFEPRIHEVLLENNSDFGEEDFIREETDVIIGLGNYVF